MTSVKAEYCSDSDEVKLTVKDSRSPLAISGSLKAVPCSRSSTATCTGDADLVVSGPTCYLGQGGALGLTETVTITVNSFSGGAGTVDILGDGALPFSCLARTFTKSGQELTLSDTSDCLPSRLKLSDAKYCSDSDTLTVTVKDSRISASHWCCQQNRLPSFTGCLRFCNSAIFFRSTWHFRPGRISFSEHCDVEFFFKKAQVNVIQLC